MSALIIKGNIFATNTLALMITSLILFLTDIAVFGQKVNNQVYYRIETNGLGQFIINHDTIISKTCRADNRGYFAEMKSLIVKVGKNHDYKFIITQPLEGYKETYNKEKFNLSWLQYNTPSHYVHIISETTLYNSLSDCDTAIAKYEPDSKIYFTLYTQEDIDKFKTYKNLLLLPAGEQKQIFIQLRDLMIKNKARALNTQAGLYGIAVAKELANRVLIENQVNPLINENDFNKFLKAYM